ncbi:hypothetical protein CC85DRAFT_284579 [Cutaneotrichosporon oleaginosum]|uniref:Uncharacterized protein n=1 Tax=Cutaneotrichosporon oleaginosum TaxID=879819 RepID=A0A0J0XQT7_9TREE|nr:uncharacterized protein CC85DRAFT_284579 [Cutaneotrichosporon oleaginosum]KLT43437.1 hypothetical protein CC85DRAFT_284579 [Cutaneotrichosporon oleaginosum]TXT05350.1 hypothetical protein COLE_06670 [Cutaneotrichosporon oleaginosum]
MSIVITEATDFLPDYEYKPVVQHPSPKRKPYCGYKPRPKYKIREPPPYPDFKVYVEPKPNTTWRKAKLVYHRVTRVFRRSGTTAPPNSPSRGPINPYPLV